MPGDPATNRSVEGEGLPAMERMEEADAVEDAVTAEVEEVHDALGDQDMETGEENGVTPMPQVSYSILYYVLSSFPRLQAPS